jgi:hypothetical protein
MEQFVVLKLAVDFDIEYAKGEWDDYCFWCRDWWDGCVWLPEAEPIVALRLGHFCLSFYDYFTY